MMTTKPVRQTERLRQRERSAWSAVVERLQRLEEEARDQHAREHSTDRGESIASSRRRRDAGRPWAQSRDGESHTEDQAAGQLWSDERLRDVDARQIQQSEAAEPERAKHRRHDRGEHDFEDGEIGQIELPHQLSGAAEARAFERPSERDTEKKRGTKRRPCVGHAAVQPWRRHDHNLRTNGATA